tara:strand:+ start:261 stop:2045 length:1785 start_codon:yes stop_codon:yes gene_type:complete
MEEVPDIESFLEWDLGDEVQASIKEMGITKPTPIQALAIGPVLAGKDVIAKAETGTGKTLAFGAPMMAKIDPARRSVLGLVLSPTRELSEQVHDVLKILGEARGVKTCLIVGGEPMQPQVKALQEGAQVVVGTPGRVIDLMNQGFLSFPWTEFVVLDEADKMLEIGFLEDIEKILATVNEYRNTLLFSATFPTPLLQLARSQTNDPVEVATASGHSTVDTITQYAMGVEEEDRPRVLADMVRSSGKDDVFLVFCDRRTDVDKLMRRMERERYQVKALHGGYDQAARFRVMSAFRTGDVKVLIATDVASRGLDVNHVTFVINLGVPRDPADYTHRIGRTGRAGRQGNAVTFVPGRDRRKWEALVRDTGFDITDIRQPRDLFSGARHGGPKVDKRERSEERGDRPRGDRGERSERPRRDREDRPAREERPAREDRPVRSDRSRGDREERPRRDRPERPAREERPRRDREERSDRPAREERQRDERPKREDRPRRDRDQRPAREERPRKDRAERPRRGRDEAPATSGGFGAGAEERPKTSRSERSDEKPARKPKASESHGSRDASPDSRPKKKREPARNEGPDRTSSGDAGGFGAGL